MKKSIALILLATLVLQSCVTYQSTSVSLKEAENMGKAQVVTTYGAKLTIQNIENRDGIYYGVINGKENVTMDSTSIQTVHLKDVEKSRKKTVGVVLGITIPVVLGIVIINAISNFSL